MRVGIYVDGYNLYYGGRKALGRGIPGLGAPGWRWLDIRALADSLVAEHREMWPAAAVHRIVYCTARINAGANPSGAADQDVYLKALLSSGSVDHIEYGNYIAKVIKRPLATEGRRGKPVIISPAPPVAVRNNGVSIDTATFIASVGTWEEKGSDVNVATLLMFDILTDVVDAAVVISNDSDLRLPVQETRRRVPVGVVNPGSGYTAGGLSADANVGVGNHWWRTLAASDYTGHQLADPAGKYRKPRGW